MSYLDLFDLFQQLSVGLSGVMKEEISRLRVLTQHEFIFFPLRMQRCCS